MADKKISALTSSTTPLAGTEVLPIVQSGATVKVAVSDLTAGRAISATAVTASTGDITSTAGNFVVGTSGKGIDFSATAGSGTSELLADYEEGTWTPTLVGDGTAGSYTVATTSATYTKIGRQVTVTAGMNITVNSAGTGTVKFGGLPFAKSSAQFIAGGITTSNVTYALTVLSVSPAAYTSGSSSDFTIAGTRSAAGISFSSITDIVTGSLIYITFSYFV